MADRPFDHNEIDEVIHGRIRLGVIAYLSGVDSAIFAELKDAVGASDGNLSTHLRRLEEAGYVGVRKGFVGRKPQTRFTLSHLGRQAWNNWLDRIEKLTRAAGTRAR
jgi:DNA-binding HxlR family transcriptional regulator